MMIERRRVVGPLLIACLLCPRAVAQEYYQFPSKVEIAWSRLYNYGEIVDHLMKLTEAYPDMLTMESIGKSVQGRDMWALTLNIEKTGPPSSKPGMYIDGHNHGNEGQGTEGGR